VKIRPKRICQLILVNFCVLALLLEIGLRTFFPALTPDRADNYVYHPRYGWLPTPGLSGSIQTGSRRISFHNNALGFRDRDHDGDPRPKLLLLGDSFVWGYEVDQESRLSERLAELRPDLDIVNLGVSGFGTDQEFLLLQDVGPHFSPKIVVLVFNPRNDHADNSTNLRYGPYYKPYFRRTDDVAVPAILTGIPVPYSLAFRVLKHGVLQHVLTLQLAFRVFYDTVRPGSVSVPDPTVSILEEMSRFLAERGTALIIGTTQADDDVAQLARAQSLPYVDLASTHEFATSGNHWTADGHREAAERIAGVLARLGY